MGPSLTPGLLFVVLLCPACLVDADAVCGPGQELNDSRECVCVDGVPGPDSGVCVACGDHEVPSGDRCECEPGYARSADTAPCEPTPEGLGDACDAATACTNPGHACHDRGYCTLFGCATSEDCAGGYACVTGDGTAYCQRPPTGQGEPCESAADCADLEAQYCQTLQSPNVCLVSDCMADGCFEGWMCCDLTVLGLGLPSLCVPEGECPVARR